MEKLLYSIPEAGELIGRRKSAAYAMAASGELETVPLGSQMMVPAAALLDLVNRLRAEAMGDGARRLLSVVDQDGRVDVTRIPDSVTLAELAQVKLILAERGEPDGVAS